MFLYKLFAQILNMSITASVVIITVMILRVLMHRLPRKYIYILWLIVGIRLVCPFAVTSPISVFNLTDKPSKSYIIQLDSNFLLQQNTDNIIDGKNIQNKIQNNQFTDKPSLSTKHNTASKAPAAINNDIKLKKTTASQVSLPMQIGTVIWVTGIVAILLWNSLLMASTKKHLNKAVLYQDNIYECDNIPSPFVMGLIHPNIYIPFRLNDSERKYILTHEMYHIHRKDYIVKFASFLILAIYWFHPLVWLSYLYMVRDMEMSCDEYVLETTKTDIRVDYSTSLLGFATNKRTLSAGLLSFGETDTRRRVKNIMKFKKHQKWIVIIAVIIIFAAGVICLTNADTKTEKTQDKETPNKNVQTTKTTKTPTVNYDAVVAEETINGYNLKLVLLPDKVSKTETDNKKVPIPADGFNLYEGTFALITYKDGNLYDEYKLKFQHNDKVYFPKDGITLHVKDYDGDGNADDFSLGQGQVFSPMLSNFMIYQFFTVDEDGSIVKFSTSYNSGESITVYPDETGFPDEFSKEFKRGKYGVIFSDGNNKKEYTSIVRLISTKDTPVNQKQQDIWQAVLDTMPKKVIKELENNGVWHFFADKKIPTYLLSNAENYDNITLRLDFQYNGNELIQYVSKGYGFVINLSDENINKKQALALAQKFAKEFCGKDLTTVKNKKEAQNYGENAIWQIKTPPRYDDGEMYAQFKDGYGALYLVQLNRNMVVRYDA